MSRTDLFGMENTFTSEEEPKQIIRAAKFPYGENSLQ